MLSKIRQLLQKRRFNKMLESVTPYICVDKSTVLLPSANFMFHTPRKNTSVTIGKDCIIGCNCIFESTEGKITIGEHSYIGSGNTLVSRNEIDIGSNVMISFGCWIYDHNSHSLNWEDRCTDIDACLQSFKGGLGAGGNMYLTKNWETVKSAPIKIYDNVWIGFNSIILKGVTIGEGAVIAAGSVVVKDVPPYVVAAGNPAKVVKEIEH